MSIFRTHFIARVFLTSFICVHVPLIFAVFYNIVLDHVVDYYALSGLVLATLVGTVGSILILHRELRPVVAVSHALKAYAERRERVPILHRSDDEIGALSDAANWSIDTLDTLLKDIERQASTDALTGLPNRRAFLRVIETEKPAMLAILDIDRFKAINDTLGHDTGDAVLKSVASTIRNALRSADVVARWGGEEFVVLLRRSSAVEAIEAMERARKAVERKLILEDRAVTFSGGLVQMSGDFEQDLVQADRALYSAKESGRNRVVFSAGSQRAAAEAPALAPSLRDAASRQNETILQGAG
ncbi:GGDEF domain-containing protein [Zhengella mangrovi]|nr:GGDEF domain-containing protein [Zhengella mangrovi]